MTTGETTPSTQFENALHELSNAVGIVAGHVECGELADAQKNIPRLFDAVRNLNVMFEKFRPHPDEFCAMLRRVGDFEEHTREALGLIEQGLRLVGKGLKPLHVELSPSPSLRYQPTVEILDMEAPVCHSLTAVSLPLTGNVDGRVLVAGIPEETAALDAFSCEQAARYESINPIQAAATIEAGTIRVGKDED